MAFDLGNGNTENKLKALAESVAKALENAGGPPMSAGYVGKFLFKGTELPPFQVLADGEAMYTDEDILGSGTVYLSMKSMEGMDNRTVFLGATYGSGDKSIILMSPEGQESDQYKITRVLATGTHRAYEDKVGFYLDMNYVNSQRGELVAGQVYSVYLLPVQSGA